MKILGGAIADDQVKGITNLVLHFTRNPDEAYYSFKLLTAGAPVEFKSCVIQDFGIATKFEQRELQEFKDEYAHIRTEVFAILKENEEEFQFHAARVDHHFTTLAEIHKLLEDEIRVCKSKNKEDWLSLLHDMRPHIIELKNLAEI